MDNIKIEINNLLGISRINKLGENQIREDQRKKFITFLKREGYTEESINILFDKYLLMDPLYIKKDETYKDLLKKN